MTETIIYDFRDDTYWSNDMRFQIKDILLYIKTNLLLHKINTNIERLILDTKDNK